MIVGHIGSGSGSSSYEIQKSLRFRESASAYLSRTPATTSNRKTFTFSCWVKRGSIGSAQGIFEAVKQVNIALSSLSISAENKIVFQDFDSEAGYNLLWSTAAVFRDTAAHFHLLVVYDSTSATSSGALKVSVNGVPVAVSFSVVVGSYLQNRDSYFNTQYGHRLGTYNGVAQFFSGYISHIAFVDGQALDPSYFGEVSAETGAWIPKKYTGTYGTNGFYLPFNDGSSLANLTADKSGNGNNWTANNISLTSGVTYDWMDDTPTNNFAVLNAVHAGRSTLSNANLTASGATDLPTIIPDYGTWYFERGGLSQTWTPPAAFPSGSGDYNFGQRPWQSTGPTGGQKALCTKNLPTGTITTSGTFSGNASTEGPFVYLNGVPTAMTINGNAVTFGNHADKLANGFKVRSSSASYNSGGSNTYSITSTGTKFKYSNAQGNP